MKATKRPRRVESDLFWAWQKPDGKLLRSSFGKAIFTCDTRAIARGIAVLGGERVVRVRVTVEVVDGPR